MRAVWAFVNPVKDWCRKVTGFMHTEAGKIVIVGQQGRRRGQV